MQINSNFFTKNLFQKPWGEEYVIFNYKNKIAVTFLKIKPDQKTSLHCHSIKKTGFIILSGEANVQIGIYKKNTFKYKPVSRLVFRPGLFHRISNKSRQNLYALEFENPYIKKDLVRLSDEYGRSKKSYEGKKYSNPIPKNYLKLKIPNKKKVNKYKFKNTEIYLKYLKNSKDLGRSFSKASVAIIDGKVCDKNNQVVIQSGEVIKYETLAILVRKFLIKKKLLIMIVKK